MSAPIGYGIAYTGHPLLVSMRYGTPDAARTASATLPGTRPVALVPIDGGKA